MTHVIWLLLLDNIILKYESLVYHPLRGFAYESVDRRIEFNSRQKQAKFPHSLQKVPRNHLPSLKLVDEISFPTAKCLDC
jgi:hypothetical protein